MTGHTERTIRRTGMLLLAVMTAGLVAACGSSTSPSAVSAITVTGAPPTVGSTSQMTATAMLASNSTEDVTSTATWTTSNPVIATVSASGLVTGLTSGSVVIQATFSSVSGSEAITIP